MLFFPPAILDSCWATAKWSWFAVVSLAQVSKDEVGFPYDNCFVIDVNNFGSYQDLLWFKGCPCCQNHQYNRNVLVYQQASCNICFLSAMAGTCRLGFGWRCMFSEEVVGAVDLMLSQFWEKKHGHQSLGCHSGTLMRTVFKSSYTLFF